MQNYLENMHKCTKYLYSATGQTYIKTVLDEYKIRGGIVNGRY